MIPLRLELRNFLSYAEDHPALSLEGIHVACLSGSNGHGKSALLDAIVWALWGEARGGTRSGDDLIRHGASEMLVALEFEMDGSRYRVCRKRTVRNKSGSTDLQFDGFDGVMWRPLAEGSIGQTQDAINRLLRMTHDTFVHAAFVQQGKADAFMMITPQQRKQVLGDILGLGRYDELSEAARDAMKDARSQAEAIATQVRAIEAELTKREQYTRRLAECTEVEKACRALVDRASAERMELNVELERLVGIERQATEKKVAHQAAQERVTSIERQIRDLLDRLAEAESLIGRATEIEQDFALFQKADDEEQLMASKFDAWCAAGEELRRSESAIDRERVRIETELRGVVQRVGEAEARVSSAAAAQGQAKTLQVKIAKFAEMEQALAQATKEMQQATYQLTRLRAEGERLRDEPEHVNERIALLGTHVECPLCGQVLGAVGLKSARERLDAELADVHARLEQTRRDYAAQAAVTKRVQERQKLLQDQIAERQTVERNLGGIQALLKQAEQDRAEIVQCREQITGLERVLSASDFARDERSKLGPLKNRLAAIGYDPERHAALRTERDRLREAPTHMQALAAARASTETGAAHAAGLREELTAAQQACAELASESAELARQSEAVPAIRMAIATKEVELQKASADLRQASQLVGEARQMVGWLDTKEGEREELSHQRDSLQRDVSAYTQLADAFGKNGIQEMVIDQATPEIEDSANDLLARLTNGRMHVSLVTQRPGRGAGTSINTLEIVVRDELGLRPYELFSGGEKFRINFAIRIALSKLLARRANAPLQMLAIDEGFGSQDREGCDRLIEAIRAVQDEFEKVLIITHLEELKEAFPVRIEVSKGPTGSTFVIA